MAHLESLSNNVKVAINDVHRFGTDSFLLEDFSNVKGTDRVVDLCSGSGIIGLLMLRRTIPPLALTSVELNDDAYSLLLESKAATTTSTHFETIHGDLCHIENYLPRESFQLVTCNPPYFQQGTGFLCPNNHRLIARHENSESCTIDDVCSAASYLLQYGGRFCLCQRPARMVDILLSLREHKLEPKRIRPVQKVSISNPWLFLVEAKKGAKSGIIWEKPLYVEDSDGNYSDEMKRIYHLED